MNILATKTREWTDQKCEIIWVFFFKSLIQNGKNLKWNKLLLESQWTEILSREKKTDVSIKKIYNVVSVKEKYETKKTFFLKKQQQNCTMAPESKMC